MQQTIKARKKHKGQKIESVKNFPDTQYQHQLAKMFEKVAEYKS